MNQSDTRSDQPNLQSVFASLLRAVLGLGAIALMIVTLIGLLGAVDGGYDAVNHFRIFLIIPGFALALLALLMRARLTAATALTALFVHAFAIVPEVYAGLQAPAGGTAPERFKLVTFNVAFRFTDPKRLRHFIERERPDLVVVQEAWGEGAKTVERLKDLLPHRRHCMNVRRCNLAVLSRHPIVAGKVRPQTDGTGLVNGARFIRAKLDVGAAAGKPGRTITVMTTHLSWPLPRPRQETQFRELAGMVSAAGHETTILAGDFNSTPWSHAMQRFDRSVPLKRVTRALHSWPAHRRIAGVSVPYPFLPIDHVYVGSSFTAKAVRRGPDLGSDHYPVIVELALR